jgi:hypothetical protein
VGIGHVVHAGRAGAAAAGRRRSVRLVTGNALALIARGTGGSWSRKSLSAFESGAANAPRLVVTFTAPGGAVPDPPPTASVNDVTVAEGTGGAASTVFTVSLSAPAAQTVTVGYATANGTATAPADYAATSGTLTFAPGVTVQPITVPLVTDSVAEPNEAFTVGLLNPVNATIADGTGQATITNDDVAPPSTPTLTINDVSVAEGTGGASSAVSLSASSTQTVRSAMRRPTAPRRRRPTTPARRARSRSRPASRRRRSPCRS